MRISPNLLHSSPADRARKLSEEARGIGPGFCYPPMADLLRHLPAPGEYLVACMGGRILETRRQPRRDPLQMHPNESGFIGQGQPWGQSAGREIDQPRGAPADSDDFEHMVAIQESRVAFAEEFPDCAIVIVRREGARISEVARLLRGTLRAPTAAERRPAPTHPPAGAPNAAASDPLMQKLTPPPAAGMTRLYRAETNPFPQSPLEDRLAAQLDWMRNDPRTKAALEASGRWFNGTLEEALYYEAHFGQGGPITFVDVPDHHVDELRASRQPAGRYSAGGPDSAIAHREFFVTPEVAAARQVLEFERPERPPEALLYDMPVGDDLERAVANATGLLEAVGIDLGRDFGCPAA